MLEPRERYVVWLVGIFAKFAQRYSFVTEYANKKTAPQILCVCGAVLCVVMLANLGVLVVDYEFKIIVVFVLKTFFEIYHF